MIRGTDIFLEMIQTCLELPDLIGYGSEHFLSGNCDIFCRCVIYLLKQNFLEMMFSYSF